MILYTQRQCWDYLLGEEVWFNFNLSATHHLALVMVLYSSRQEAALILHTYLALFCNCAWQFVDFKLGEKSGDCVERLCSVFTQPPYDSSHVAESSRSWPCFLLCSSELKSWGGEGHQADWDHLSTSPLPWLPGQKVNMYMNYVLNGCHHHHWWVKWSVI